MLSVEEITSTDRWRAVKSDWDRLAERVADASLFLTHDWFDCCLRAFGDGKDLLILLVRDGSEAIGAAPLWRHSRNIDGHALATIGFITGPDTPFVDFVIKDERRQEALTKLTEHLFSRTQRDWDVVFLELPKDSKNKSGLVDCLSKQSRRYFEWPISTTPYIPLEEDWEVYWRRRSAKLRKTRRNIINRVTKRGKVELQCHDRDETGQVLKDILAISEKSWKHRKGVSIANREETTRFFEALTSVAADNGWLKVWILKVDGVPVAMEYDLASHGQVYALRADFDERYEEISPGAYLEYYVMKSIFGTHHVRYNTGPGYNLYKLQWAEWLQENVAVAVCGKTPRGRLFWGAESLRSLLGGVKRGVRGFSVKSAVAAASSGVKAAIGWPLARVMWITGGFRHFLSFTQSWSLEKVGFPHVKRRTKQPFVILYEHRVSDAPHPFFSGETIGTFRRHLEILKDYYQVLPLEELARRAAEDDVPPNAAAITFDDGYLDNYSNAFPVLESLELPATIFLVTKAVSENSPIWHDRVFEAFRLTEVKHFVFRGDMIPLETRNQKQSGLERVLGQLRKCRPEERDEHIEELVGKLGVPQSVTEDLAKMTWDQVREMHGNGISFGAHTVTHPILSRLPLKEAAREIVASKETIEREIGSPVNLFAYPNGARDDFNEGVKGVLKEAGFACALSTLWGTNDSTTDRFELKRMGFPDSDPKLSLVKLGWYHLIS